MQRLYSIIPHFADSIRTISNIKVFYTCLFILITFNLKAQIPSFTLNTTVTDETCVGNGTITFGVVGVDPSATISYVVYKLPDLTTPVSITNPTVGLQSGTYRVIATQTLGSLTNTQTVDVVIANNIVPLDYTITSVANGCGNSNNITIIVNAGVATLYEIFWGPVTIPPQASPVFTNVPAGVYQIRVFNDCGAGSVKTFTLLSGAPQINVASGVAAAQLPSCQTVTVTNALTPSSTSVLNYPLTLTYTIFPPDGSTPITLNQTIASGPATQYTASAVMPSYNGQTFTYTLSVTDNCGGTFSQNDNSIQATLRATLASVPAECGTYYLRVRLSYFLGPFTVTFTQSPAGFSPSAFNSSHPNFTNSPVSYGSATNPVPFGDYTVLVTDACGNSATASVLLEDIPAFPSVAFFPFPGCESYKSRVEILIPGYQIATATLTVAPSSYPNALPENLSAFINAQGKLIIPELVTGVYTVVLTDTCGNTYPPFDFTVPPLATSISASTRTDCEANDIGSIRLIGNNTLLTSVVITSAPAAFSAGTLPFDVSSNIAANGAFYMGNLPVGSYAFLVTDNCGVQNTVTRTIADYSVTESSYAIIPQCGTFALTLNHTSNAGAPQFWLQRFYPSLGLWGHPETGVPYVDGIVPDTTTSRQIQANATTLNITQTGQFRIVKSFEGFQSGTPDPKFCWEVLHEFNFDGEFQIIDILKVTCSGLLSDVQIITNGVAPLIFRIVEKNDAPFLIDNGDDSVFTGLEPGFYGFTVQDACGVIKPGFFDVSQLPAIVTATAPGNLIECDDESNDGIVPFDLTSQIPGIITNQDPSTLTVTFHNSLQDADDNLNIIATPTNYSSSGETVYVRVLHSGGCHETTSFNLVINPSPQFEIDDQVPICVDGTTTLSVPAGFSSYEWSTGEITRQITVDTPGSYSVIVTNNYPTGSCSSTQNFTVFQSAPPVITDVVVTDWTQDQNTITVELQNASGGNYVFSLDNINFQPSNVFTGLTAGVYNVFVKDLNGCGDDSQEVFILSYPPFFTPNADGFNDYWRVRFAELEPNLQTYIYDRYGKLITGFLSGSQGWDGTLNGKPLFATDYWFVVIRQDGRTLRGHFALKR